GRPGQSAGSRANCGRSANAAPGSPGPTGKDVRTADRRVVSERKTVVAQTNLARSPIPGRFDSSRWAAGRVDSGSGLVRLAWDRA
ncbi:hypothetical protein, partial [Alienimonas chondri]|uniref:hypothetical protein n=1 Tax=Alienimonas chondri TaxID=2681879 RepID=UPI0019D557EB